MTIQQEKDELEWINGTDDILETKISYDLGGSLQYLDDDIGEMAFNMDVMLVKENMAQLLLETYNDNIEDLVVEHLGSDFRGTI
jgi:hypothetical protein